MKWESIPGHLFFIQQNRFCMEYKLEVLPFMKEPGKPAADVAGELEIHRKQLRKWQQELPLHAEGSFPGHGRRPAKVDKIV
jgi:transposase-like protein